MVDNNIFVLIVDLNSSVFSQIRSPSARLLLSKTEIPCKTDVGDTTFNSLLVIDDCLLAYLPSHYTADLFVSLLSLSKDFISSISAEFT